MEANRVVRPAGRVEAEAAFVVEEAVRMVAVAVPRVYPSRRRPNSTR